MAEIILEAEIGRPLGSRATRRLRAEGKIPGVVYGHGTDPVLGGRGWPASCGSPCPASRGPTPCCR